MRIEVQQDLQPEYAIATESEGEALRVATGFMATSPDKYSIS